MLHSFSAILTDKMRKEFPVLPFITVPDTKHDQKSQAYIQYLLAKQEQQARITTMVEEWRVFVTKLLAYEHYLDAFP